MDILAHSRMRNLSVPDQLFSYADASRSASNVMCQKMKSDVLLRTWPNAAVVLMLAAPAMEHFLKGALFTRDSTTNIWDYYHGISDLSAEYELQFPEPQFKWEIPLTSGFSDVERRAWMTDVHPCLTEAQLNGLKLATPAPSILYRYPTDNGGGRVWHGLYGFESHVFLLLLSQVENDFDRIKSQLHP